jgi:thymidylate synthase ThyX
MAFAAKILADSLAPSGKRLTTFEVTYPRCIHSEIMTHRMLSKNAASSRAIPSEKLIARVMEDPFIPETWGKNQKGMQADVELTREEQARALDEWLTARNSAVGHARNLLALGLHKQIVNRIIEPFMWITIIVSATEWSNFFGLRVHPDAEPHFQKIARMMLVLYNESTPNKLDEGEWHVPLISNEDRIDLGGIDLAKVSVGRCARVSYLTHDGRRDFYEDIALHDRLMNANPGHWSPFEHVAQAGVDPNLRSGNFTGWRQYRKTFGHEHIGGRMP